jgi:hypothetical protein
MRPMEAIKSARSADRLTVRRRRREFMVHDRQHGKEGVEAALTIWTTSFTKTSCLSSHLSRIERKGTTRRTTVLNRFHIKGTLQSATVRDVRTLLELKRGLRHPEDSEEVRFYSV